PTGDVAERRDHQRDRETLREREPDEVCSDAGGRAPDEGERERAEELSRASTSPVGGHGPKREGSVRTTPRSYCEAVASRPGKEGLLGGAAPHCHRHFRGKLLAGGSAQHAGFKCPHCKLFVAYERTVESAQAAD